MERKEFLKLCGILGIGLPAHFSLLACTTDENLLSDFKGKVLIIGAGAGGLSAAYLLSQRGVDFEILEASSIYGGRMRINTSFADFPIPLGAEWLETNPSIFQEIVNNPQVKIDIKTVVDSPDRKFVGSSWFNFFDEYILPPIKTKIKYNVLVQSIDYSGEKIKVRTKNAEYMADKVIVSVPVKILQDKEVTFVPNLPQEKQDAIANIPIWEGFKAFFEFTENFYGDGYEYAIRPETDGQKIYYNASFGQNTKKNILGLFAVGKPARDFLSFNDKDLKASILNDLDKLFNKRATSSYLKHISQNWNEEPFIKSGYISDYADWRAVKAIGKSVAGKVYFAGGEYTDGEDWVSVHIAAQSAKVAVTELLK